MNHAVLHFFDPKLTSVIQVDASQHSLSAFLLQLGKPVAYVSCSLSTSELNYIYAQIYRERNAG